MKYFLSICAIVRNEADYLAEWIEFHKLQGVEHFYLYHNAGLYDDIPTSQVLYDYFKAGKTSMSYIPWDQRPGQLPAYHDCLQNCGNESEWIAFIDVDEFLWSPEYIDIKEPVKWNLLGFDAWQQDKDIAAIAPRWVFYGSNNHKEKTDGLVIERFTRRQPAVDQHCKSIIRPALVRGVGKNVHTFRLKNDARCVDERGNTLPENYAVQPGGSGDILQVAHFHTKSYAEYIERRKNPRADNGEIRLNLDEQFTAHDRNEVEDTRLRDLYAAKIKERLK